MARAFHFEAIDDCHKGTTFCQKEENVRECIEEAAIVRNQTQVGCEAVFVERGGVCRTGTGKVRPTIWRGSCQLIRSPQPDW